VGQQLAFMQKAQRGAHRRARDAEPPGQVGLGHVAAVFVAASQRLVEDVAAHALRERRDRLFQLFGHPGFSVRRESGPIIAGVLYFSC
jgi:hypothetical protein